MNKFLLGTTALISAAVFAAPAFAAEKIQLELRGYHVGGVAYTDADLSAHHRDILNPLNNTTTDLTGDPNEINFGSDSEIHFRGSTTLDNGLKVSFRAELELEDNSDVDGDADQIDEVYIQLDGGFGRIQFGQNDGAMYQQHITAPNAFVGHGVNNPDMDLDPFVPVGGLDLISTYGQASGDDIKITYFTPNMNGFQVGASYTPNPCKNDTGYASCVYDEFGRNYLEISGTFRSNLDNISFGISGGYGTGESAAGDAEPTEWTIGGEIGFGGFTVGGSYRDGNLTGINGWEESQWDAGASYETGPWTLSLNYAQGRANSGPTFEIGGDGWTGGATYMYGPGMQIGFGVTTLDGGIDLRDPGLFHDSVEFDGMSFFVENVLSF